MTIQDPFGAPAPDEAQAPPAPVAVAPTPQPVVTAPAPVVLANTATGDLSVTFKGDGTFAYPWIVPKYGSVAEALVDLGADSSEVASLTLGQRWLALFERAKKMNDHFASLGGGAAVAPAQAAAAPNPSAPPPGATQAPGGEVRHCKHGQMQFKSDYSAKTNKVWKAFFCPTPKGTADQCPAEFLR